MVAQPINSKKKTTSKPVNLSSDLNKMIKREKEEQGLLRRSEIIKKLDKIEGIFKNRLEKILSTKIKKAIVSILDEQKEEDKGKTKEAIKNKWWLKTELEKLLYQTWLTGAEEGAKDGTKEISNLENSDIGHFAVAEPANFRNLRAEEAIAARANRLASDVSESEWEEIRQHVLDAIQPQSPEAGPISRTELIGRLEGTLGFKAYRFRNRARTIARTEITNAYNVGRLDSYVRSELVTHVIYRTILDDRRCDICESRQGLVISLTDATAMGSIQIPAHPNCRCVWSPVLADSPLIDEEERQPENRKVVEGDPPWMTAAILASVLAAGIAGAKVKVGVKQVAKAITSPAVVAQVTQEIVKASQDQVELEEKAKVTQTRISRGKLSGAGGRMTVRAKKIPANWYRAPIMLSVGVDLQTANLAQLREILPEEIPTAFIENLIRYRNRNLGFNSVEDLLKIPGFGQKRYEAIAALTEGQELFLFFNPNFNNRFDIWGKSGGRLSKKQVRVIYQDLTDNPVTDISEIEERLRAKGVDETTIGYLKRKSSSVYKSSQKSVTLESTEAINNFSRNVELNLKSLEIQIEQIDTIVNSPTIQNASTRLSTSISVFDEQSRLLGNSLERELKSYNQRTLILEKKVEKVGVYFRSLLDPDIEDYFAYRSRNIQAIREEIEAIEKKTKKITGVLRYTKYNTERRQRQLRTNVNNSVKNNINTLANLPYVEKMLEQIELQIRTIPGETPQRLLDLHGHLSETIRGLKNELKKPLKSLNIDEKIGARLTAATKNNRELTNRIARLKDSLDSYPSNPKQLPKNIKKRYNETKRAVLIRTPTRGRRSTRKEKRLTRKIRRQEIEQNIAGINNDKNRLLNDKDLRWQEAKLPGRFSNGRKLNLLRKKQEKIAIGVKRYQNDFIELKEKLRRRSAQLREQLAALQQRLEGSLSDPLEPPYFTAKGSRRNEIDKQISRIRAEIDNANTGISSLERKQRDLEKQISTQNRSLNELLDDLRNRELDPIAKSNLDNQIQRQIAELQALNIVDVGKSYRNKAIPNHIKTLEAIADNSSPLLKTKLTDEIEIISGINKGAEVAVNKSTTNKDWIDIYTSKQELKAVRESLNKLPRDVNKLNKSRREAWRNIEAIGKQTRKARKSVVSALTSYEANNRDLGDRLGDLQDDIQNILGDLELLPGSTTSPYRQNLNEAIARQTITVNQNLEALEEALDLLGQATSVEAGLDLVYSDLKRIRLIEESIGLSVTGGQVAIGLDEAAEVRRRIIAAINEQIESSRTIVENTIERSAALNVPRYKLRLIEDELAALGELQRRYKESQSQASQTLRDGLREWLDIDPISYRDLDRPRIRQAIAEKTQENINRLNALRTRLFDARNEIAEDVQAPILYGNFSNQDEILSRVTELRDRAQQLQASSRPGLAQVYNKLLENQETIYGPGSISDSINKGLVLSSNQQRVFNSLTEEQREIFNRASTAGVLDNYDDLYRLSYIHNELEIDFTDERTFLARIFIPTTEGVSLKTRVWQEVSDRLTNLRNAGYPDVTVELIDGGRSARLVNIPDVRNDRGGKFQLRKLIDRLGVDENGQPLEVDNAKISSMAGNVRGASPNLSQTKDYSYQEVLQAIELNRNSRWEAHNRLEVFGFSRLPHLLAG
jgi:SPP1 gp7 family putative phage head morphogenesis protein